MLTKMYGEKMYKYIYSKFIKKIQISSLKKTNIDKSSRIGSSNNLIEVKMGKLSYIGNNCTVVMTTIGSYCSIADNCIIGGASHPVEWISTSPVFYKGKNILEKNYSNNNFDEYKRTIIGNDVWIANNVLIKAGVTIGDGAVIGMGSVVTKDVGNYEIWGGNPAKIIRKRFSDEDILNLNSIEWWNLDEKRLQEIADLMNNKKKFLEHFNGRNI